MANDYPCPNPGCTHVFPAAQLRATPALTCPACGLVFHLRPAAPNTKLPSAELPPIFASDMLSATTRQALARPQWSKWTVPGIFLVCFLGLLVVLWNWLPQVSHEVGDMSVLPGPSRQEPTAETARVESAKLNFRFELPELPWQQDLGETREALRAAMVLHRDNPDAWLALLVRDARTRSPRPEELRDDVVRRLESYFTDNLETEPGGEMKLAGRPAQRLIFRGDIDDTTYSGEACLLVHQGLTYALVTWAPASATQGLRGEFEDLRRRFALLKSTREGWKEAAVARTFHGHKVRCRLRDDSGLWREWEPASDYDATADLALIVRDLGEATSQDKLELVAASVLLLLPKDRKGNLDAELKAARAHVEEQQQALGLAAKIEPFGSPAVQTLGDLKSQVQRFKVQLGETKQRLVLVAVGSASGRTMVWQCECDWRNRDDWEPRFLKLLETFHLDES